MNTKNNANKNNANKNNTNIKFCKVCQDSGKSESEFRSHNVRQTKDPNSFITCPTLLSQECRNCFKKGHTIKYCKQSQQQVQPANKVKPVKEKKEVIKNIFSILEEENDNEQEQEQPKLAPTPVTNGQLKTASKNVLNYKTLIEKHNQEDTNSPILKIRNTATLPNIPMSLQNDTRVYKPEQGRMNWATAESDSEDDI
jgi:hypothetical protein